MVIVINYKLFKNVKFNYDMEVIQEYNTKYKIKEI